MDFAVETGKEMVLSELSKRTFDESGSIKNVKYKVSGVKISNATFPQVHLTPVPNVGMEGIVKGVALRGTGNVW